MVWPHCGVAKTWFIVDKAVQSWNFLVLQKVNDHISHTFWFQPSVQFNLGEGRVEFCLFTVNKTFYVALEVALE
jgi:hypothetical protein